MENYFKPFREQIIGIDTKIQTPYRSDMPLVYADWTASGRNYKKIEETLVHELMPLVANTHTDTNTTGSTMTYAYHKAQKIIKEHVGANSKDVLISSNSGMTGVVNKFQRILGLKIHEKFKDQIHFSDEERPIVFITHMEHHSNQTTWLETIADVKIIPPTEDGLVSPENFEKLIQNYAHKKTKYVSITACSNVTGIETPYMEIAKIAHQYNSYIFVDFACSGPYVDMNMHENDSTGAYLDAIFFSPHKFLGGPGTTGILVFNEKLYSNTIPDNPGGGTVDWTNPWGGHKYIDDIEAREDGGTPSFLQTIKSAMCIKLKEEMGTANIRKREEEILSLIFQRLEPIEYLHILAAEHKHRLGVISFYIDGLHYNVGVKMLNDRYGIQTRGGCSCAGTYGHYLLNVDEVQSSEITTQISSGDCSLKPGWIRMSIHPTHTDQEIEYILDAIEELSRNFNTWMEDYDIDLAHAVIKHKKPEADQKMESFVNQCFLMK
ncbi:MAG: aminotransferase class V-fold PLP-dependent enzyme [Crocinitomicaceae bacterium]|nr:aminotransferase class V-fold PLP-dependent enzyme [Crocinitomicaceae bacterium]